GLPAARLELVDGALRELCGVGPYALREPELGARLERGRIERRTRLRLDGQHLVELSTRFVEAAKRGQDVGARRHDRLVVEVAGAERLGEHERALDHRE